MKKLLTTIALAGMILLNTNCDRYNKYRTAFVNGSEVLYDTSSVKKNKYEIVEHAKFSGLNTEKTIYYDYLDEFGNPKVPEMKVEGIIYENPNEGAYKTLNQRLTEIRKELKI